MEKQDIVKLTKDILASPKPGLYFLYGEEEFLKHRFLLDFKNAVIPADLADLNCSTLSGPDQAERLLELAYTLPQFCDSRMVVWYNSGYPLMQQRYKKKADEVMEKLKDFPYLYLVIYSTPDEFGGTSRDERDALNKMKGTALNFELLSPARIKKWIVRHFEAEGIKASEDDALYLTQRLGTGMTELSSAVSKLCAYVTEKGRDEVSRADIEELIPVKVSFSAFFISDNIRKRDPSALCAYVADAKSRAEKPQTVLSQIIAEAEKLCRIKLAQKSGAPYQLAAKQLGINEYVVKLAYGAVSDVPEKRFFRFLHACHEADRAVKSTSGDNWEIINQLICSI